MAYQEVTHEEFEKAIKDGLRAVAGRGGGIGSLLSLDLVSCDVGSGELVLKHTAIRESTNPAGNQHGGVTAWLFDSAMGILCKGYSSYGSHVTMDIHVNYLRPIHVGDEIFIKSRVTRGGRTITNICAEMTVDDKTVATADSIYYRI